MSHRGNTSGWVKDGNLAFHGGVDASVPASDIQRNQVAHAINCTMRGGPISPRPGWKPRPLTFSTPEQATAFKSGLFQHGSFYASENTPALISSHSGRFFLLNLLDYSVQEITPVKPDTTLDINSPILDIGWSEQMGTYWVYQDNQSWPVIFNGSVSRRSDPNQQEIPIGNVMSYSQGRLAVALPDRHTYRVGDLLFGPSGTAAANYRDAVLKFTENNFLNEGGDLQARVFGAPTSDGPITAMKSIAQMDQQLGQGPLMIGTPYNFFTVQLPFDRTTWKDLANPQQTNSPLIGPLSQDGMLLINGDIWYRSFDGIRSYIMAQRQFRSWGNTPMSAEIFDILEKDTQQLLEHGSAVLFDNRLLMTISPMATQYGVYHRGLAVMDFNLVSTINKKLGPVWEGIWIGLRILKIVKGLVGHSERCFAWVLNCDNEIEVWELIPGSKFDGTRIPIDWSFETPSYNCNDSDQLKRLETARIIVNNLVGTLNGNVTFRTDQNPCWTPWDTFTECSKAEDCCSEQTTKTQGNFSLPAVGATIQIGVLSSTGITTAFPTITIGGYTVTLISIDSAVNITVRNDVANQVDGYVPSGTTLSFCGYDCAGPKTYREQPRASIRLHSPPDAEDVISGHFLNRGYEFQLRFQLTGSAEIRQLRIFAKDEPDIAGFEGKPDST